MRIQVSVFHILVAACGEPINLWAAQLRNGYFGDFAQPTLYIQGFLHDLTLTKENTDFPSVLVNLGVLRQNIVVSL